MLELNRTVTHFDLFRGLHRKYDMLFAIAILSISRTARIGLRPRNGLLRTLYLIWKHKITTGSLAATHWSQLTHRPLDNNISESKSQNGTALATQWAGPNPRRLLSWGISSENEGVFSQLWWSAAPADTLHSLTAQPETRSSINADPSRALTHPRRYARSYTREQDF